jgi:hypothetical protein
VRHQKSARRNARHSFSARRGTGVGVSGAGAAACNPIAATDSAGDDGGYSYASSGGDPHSDADERLLLLRALKTTVHEIAHMFCIKHCIEYNCAMNGSIDIEESDARSPHLCPTCLAKLQHAVGFDIVTRYEDLARYYKSRGMRAEASFCRGRLEVIESKVKKWSKFKRSKR